MALQCAVLAYLISCGDCAAVNVDSTLTQSEALSLLVFRFVTFRYDINNADFLFRKVVVKAIDFYRTLAD